MRIPSKAELERKAQVAQTNLIQMDQAVIDCLQEFGDNGMRLQEIVMRLEKRIERRSRHLV